MRCDLHTHTELTDGFHSFEYVIKEAKKQKLKALSLTDHNSIEAFLSSGKIAEKYNIELIPGVEINTDVTELLAYFFDKTYEPLLKILDDNKKITNQISIEKIYWLKENGFNIEIDDVLKFTGPTKNLMSTHIALELLRNGYAKDINEAFSNILKKIRLSYNPKKIKTKKVIKEIENAGGVTVLPHPWFLPLSIKKDIDGFLLKMAGHGLMGVETTGPHESTHELFLKNCKKIVMCYDLIETGGSDFHGLKYFPDNVIGKYTVDYSVVEKLRKKSKN